MKWKFVLAAIVLLVLISSCITDQTPTQQEKATPPTTAPTLASSPTSISTSSPTPTPTPSPTSTPTSSPTPTPASSPTPTPTPSPTPTSAVRQIGDAVLVSTFNKGLNIVDENGCTVLNEEFHMIREIAVDEQGHVWVVHTHGLSVFDGLRWTDYSRYGEGIAIDSEGRIWVGHFEGVSVLDNGQWLCYSSEEFGLGRFASSVNDVAVDHRDRVWVATSSGVAVFDGNNWTSYDTTSGLAGDSVEVILVDSQDRIWVGHDYGVEVFDGTSWTFYGEKYGVTPKMEVDALSQVQSLAADYQGRIWVGTFGKGISVFDGSSWITYGSNFELRGSPAYALASDSQGRIWVGTTSGLVVLDGNNWSYYTKNTCGLLTNEVRAIIITGAGPRVLPPAPAPQPGGVTGKVLRGGQPLAGARVQVCWQALFFFSGPSPCEGDIYEATTDGTGAFRIDGIPFGKYDLAIRTPDGQWYTGLMTCVQVVDGETVNIGEFKL